MKAEVVAALRTIVEVAANAEQQQAPTSISTYYDQHTAPCGANAYKSAAKAGAFRTWRVGKRLLARRTDVDAWIESPSHEVTPGTAQPADDVDVLLAAGGVARKAGE